jgi:uncharacterized protein (DUF4415 family)
LDFIHPNQTTPHRRHISRNGGHPQPPKKTLTSSQKPADVVYGVRATGKGYNRRVERVLREALAKGEL